MTDKQPLLLLPGLLCDPILWAHQTEYLSDIADMTVADLTRHDNVADMAASAIEGMPMVAVGRVQVAERVVGSSWLDDFGAQPCAAMSSRTIAT